MPPKHRFCARSCDAKRRWRSSRSLHRRRSRSKPVVRAIIGRGAAIVRAYGEVDPAAAGQALRQAWQERCGGRRGALRGHEPANNALRPGEEGRAASGLDASGGARSVDPQSHAVANAIRGYAAEFGLTAAKGMCKIEPLLARIAADETLPELARELFALHGREYRQSQARL